MKNPIFALTALLFIGATQIVRTQSTAPEDAAATVARLRKELLAPPSNTPEGYRVIASASFIRPRVDGIRSLVRSEVLKLLAAGATDPKDLLLKITPLMRTDLEVPPTAVGGKLYGQDFLVLGYYILHGSDALFDATAVIEGFSKANGAWQAASQTGESLSNSIVRIQALPCPWTTEVWFLAHGQQTGVMQYTEKAVIYSYDGRDFKLLWAPPPMRGAEYTVMNDSIKVHYQDPDIQRGVTLTVMLIPGGPVEAGRVPD